MSTTPDFIYRRIAHRPNLVKIVENISWLFFDKILRMGIGLLVGVWVARYLGPEQFGLLNFATAFTAIFSAVAALGLQGIVVRDIVQNPEHTHTTLGTAALLLLLGGFVTYLLAVTAIFIFKPEDALARSIVAILGAMMLFKASDIAVYWYESQVLSKYTVWVQNAVFLVFAVVKIILILKHAPLIVFVWAILAEVALVATILMSIMNRRSLSLMKLRFSWTRAVSLLQDSWPLILSAIAITVYMKIDQIMLGQMIGDEAVGIYSAATRISEVWYFMPMVVVASVFPSILDAKKRSEGQYYKRLQRLYDLMVWLSVIIAVPMTFLSTYVVTTLFGIEYVESGQVLAIHIWAAVFVFLGVASSKWFIAENRQILSLQRTILGAVVNVVLNIILIPKHTVIGAAWATVISQFSVGVLFDIFQKETRTIFFMKIKSFNPVQLYKLIRLSDV